MPFFSLLSYAILRIAAAGLRLIPLPAASWGADAAMRLLAMFMPARRRIALEQARRSFPSDPAAAGRAASESLGHLGRLSAEFVRQNALPPACRVAGLETIGPMLAAMADGRGLILCTGHFGNWERGGALAAALGIIEGAIARPLAHPLVDAWIRRIREGSGQKIFDKAGSIRRDVLPVLRAGKGFGILIDQDAGPGGIFVPFFGRLASTTATPARLSFRTGAPLVVATVLRDGRPGYFKLAAGPVRLPAQGNDERGEIHRLTALITRDLEDLIRLSPGQYLWMHRRWKTRPRNET